MIGHNGLGTLGKFGRAKYSIMKGGEKQPSHEKTGKT